MTTRKVTNQSTEKIQIQLLARLCKMKGVKRAVISPGSRNAPLSVAFNRQEGIECISLVDERSAGFYALGIAQQTDEPVVVICTSGTALLNLSPAIAEAYYQQIPLIVISADRPNEWIDQDDSQTIRQENILEKIVKFSCCYRSESDREDDVWYNNRIVNDAINIAMNGAKGPVHINVPLEEPLCRTTEATPVVPRVFGEIKPAFNLTKETAVEYAQSINCSLKVMILVSMQRPNDELNKILNTLSGFPQIVVLTETISNMRGDKFIANIDRTISRLTANQNKTYKPDLLITFGGPLISKFIKRFLRENKPAHHWHIGEQSYTVDTYTILTQRINSRPVDFLRSLLPHIQNNKSKYAERWVLVNKKAEEHHQQFIKTLVWSDFKAFSVILPLLPKESKLQLSNGTSVRYHQLFKNNRVVRVDANRGTSGIDGSTSTASGAASTFYGDTTLITGDLSFLYDINAIWNKKLSSSFKIIVINNNGGGIFRFIKGPSTLSEMEEYFEATHSIDISKLAEAYGLNYISAQNEKELKRAMKIIYAWDKPTILEVFTPREVNDEILRSYFK